jgi:hypothetical protein
MDPRVVPIAVVFAVGLVVVGILGCHVRSVLKLGPIWSIVATVAIFLAGFVAICAMPQLSSWIPCLSKYLLVCVS